MATDDSLARTLLFVIAVLVLVPFVVMAAMMPLMGMWGWGSMWDGGMWNATGPGWMGLLVWLVFVLVLLGIGYVLYGAIRRPSDDHDEALEALRLAYARGDISDEEYENRRERLDREQ